MLLRKIMVLSFLLLVGCGEDKKTAQETLWAESVALLTNVEKIGDRFAYMITYDAPESTAVNAEDQPIKGPIDQSGLLDRKPINNQKIKLRYRQDEPIIFELLEEIKFE